MKFKSLLLSILFNIAACGIATAQSHFAGGDISLLPEYENAKAQYYDENGKPVPDVLSFCHEQGLNAMRVRLFVNPSDFPGNDPNVCQTLDYIKPLCKRIKDAGFNLMLDFHYSDTWADPAKQWTPKAWQSLSDDQLYAKIYEYTKDCLQQFNALGATPDFIQTGNEISYGMLWGAPTDPASSLKKCYSNSEANWPRLINLLNNAIKACREECPDAKIILHTERIADQQVQQNFYQQMKKNNVNYDIIGLSYYPYFHGKINLLDTALANLESAFPEKQIMIVETGYPYAWEVPGTDQPVDYAYTDDGQNQFTLALLGTAAKHPACIGIFWWWMEYNAKGTSLTGWYNAPLWDSRTGYVLKSLATLASFNNNDAVVDIENDTDTARPQQWYDLFGRPVANPSAPGLYISPTKKILLR